MRAELIDPHEGPYLVFYIKMKNNNSIEQSILEDCIRSVTVSDDGRIIGDLTFAPDFPAFQGHFPNQPVLPAVVQTAAVRLIAAQHLGAQLIPARVDRAKFKNMIGPEKVTVSMKIDRAGNEITINFSIATDKGKAATGTLSCKVVENTTEEPIL